MDIHFCDLCNESVPQSDLDIGRAFLRRGRVICARCERAMTHETEGAPHGTGSRRGQTADFGARASAAVAPAAVESGGRPDSVARPMWSEPTTPPPPLIPATGEASAPVRSSTGVVLAMVALVFAAGGVAILNEQIQRIGEREAGLEAQLRAQGRSLDDVDRAARASRASVAALASDLEHRLVGERENREIALASLRSLSERLTQEQGDLSLKMKELDVGAVARTQVVDRRADELSHRLAKSEDENRALLDRIAKLEEEIQQARTFAPAPVAGLGVPIGAAGGALWSALVPDLGSPKAAVRWEAVDQIGQARDAESVPFLVPMLKDADVFVRMATARVLGDIQATSAVPALIDALEDGEAAVREATLGALRVITGKDLRFDPLASDAERAKKVKAWRDWWKKAEEEGASGKSAG
jgi:hypothetical protein